MKKHKFLAIAALAVLTLTSTRVWADDEPKQDASYQDDAAAISVSDLEALSNRISALEKSKGSSLQVDGLFQFWYTHDSWGANSGTSSNDYSTSKNQWDSFSVKRAEISLTGSLPTDPKVSFKISLDPSLASFSGIGSPSGATLTYEGVSSTNANINPFSIVKDLYTQISYSPYASIIIGQNKLWNELEGRTPSKDLDFNNYTNIGGNGFGNKRDLGVALTGTAIPLGPIQGEYYVAALDGAGQSTFDNNVDKDITGRVDFTFDQNLLVGVNGYSGWEPNGDRNYFGLESRWVSGGFKVQGEFLTGSVNVSDNNAANNSVWTPSISSGAGIPALPSRYVAATGQINPTGYYLLANYRLGDWRLGARWDGYNFNQGGAKSDGEWDTYTFGLDWYQAKDAVKFSVNWEDHLFAGVDEYNIWTVQSQLYI